MPSVRAVPTSFSQARVEPRAVTDTLQRRTVISAANKARFQIATRSRVRGKRREVWHEWSGCGIWECERPDLGEDVLLQHRYAIVPSPYAAFSMLFDVRCSCLFAHVHLAARRTAPFPLLLFHCSSSLHFPLETQETFWEKPAKKVIHHGTYNAGSSSGQKSRSQSRSSASGKSRQRSATKVSGGRSSSKVKATGSKKSRKSKPKEEKRKKAPQSQSSKRRKRASGTDDEDASGSGSTDEKEEEEEEDWNSGFEHTAANNARPEDIALAHDVDIDDLLKVNLANFPVIKAVSRLKAGTRIALPFRIYNAFNNETPTTIASKFKLPVSQVVKLNVNRHIGLRSKSKLRADTDLVLNPLGVAGGGQTGVTIAAARAMGPKTSHKKK